MKTALEVLTGYKKFHISLGLERTQKILNLLGNPENSFKCFHIAGTNGKGSTSKIINDILIENFKNSDTKIGLFTSPHITRYNERIKINNEDIPDYTFNKLVDSIDNFAQKNGIELTEFELLTVVAFYYFYLKGVKYVVLETGLGGTYDSTNVIKEPLCCVITTIDFDHTERLGKTIDEIASQKAGIIKKNSKVVISKNNLGYKTILNKAKEENASFVDIPDVKILFEKEKNFAVVENKKYGFNLLGSHQADNLALALGAISTFDVKIKDSAIKTALKNVKWKLRLDYDKEKNLLKDGAHNPSGIKALRKFLDDRFKDDKKTFIFGCLKNKDYKKMLEILLKEEDEFYFFEFDYPNALKFDELDEKYKTKAIKIESIQEIENIIKKPNLKIVCGSLYMLGKLNEIL